MKLEYTVIIIIAIVCGFLISKMIDKRNNNIIKLLIKKDLLPASGEGTKWIQGAVCYMGDGSLGKTEGLYCAQISVV